MPQAFENDEHPAWVDTLLNHRILLCIVDGYSLYTSPFDFNIDLEL